MPLLAVALSPCLPLGPVLAATPRPPVVHAESTIPTGPFVGLTALFPMHGARDGRVDSLQARSSDCLERSMDGEPLTWNSKEVNAMLICMRCLARN